MTTTSATSAYPFDLSELLPQARALAQTLGDTPSRNRLMRELRIGAPKATALREALNDERETPTGDTHERDAPVLTLVPDLVPDADDTPDRAEAEPVPDDEAPEPPVLATGDGHPDTISAPPGVDVDTPAVRPARSWPVWLLAAPAFVAIWSGWVGLGELTGFGMVHPLPGIADGVSINSAITLPVGVETYAAYALAVWLTGRAPVAARRFARLSAIGSLLFGALGQVAYHLMVAAHVGHAPWWITTAVACLPVAVLGMGAALAHLVHANRS